MSVPTILYVVALVLGALAVARSRLRGDNVDLVALGVTSIALGLLWTALT